MNKVKIGIVGCGNISGIYLTNLTRVFQELVEIKAVCDLIPERSQAAREAYGVSVVERDQDLYDDPEIELILNITRPWEHYGVNKAALLAG